jgi:UDP-glucose 4-epimerase
MDPEEAKQVAKCIVEALSGAGLESCQYSVSEVVDAVRMVAGVDFETRQAPRRAGDPASIVANSDQLLKLGWKPELNDLPKMIEHAHNWEEN